MNGEAWVFTEFRHGEPTENSLKLVCEGRRIADSLKLKLRVLTLGCGEDWDFKTFGNYGAQAVFAVRENVVKDSPTEIAAIIVYSLAKNYKPNLILFAATPNGDDVAGRVAAKLDIGLISNCIDFSFKDGGLMARKPIYDDVAHLTLTWSYSETMVATVNPNVLEFQKTPKVENVDVEWVDDAETETFKTKVLGYIKSDPKTVDISEAELVVGIGRGIGGKENLKIIDKFAEALGAAIGGTRPAVDESWIPYEKQIGLSGKKIAPKLYVACGISGASYHTLGVKGSKFTVAVNIDRSAPIFKIADLGAVGDFKKYLPAMSKELLKLKASKR